MLSMISSCVIAALGNEYKKIIYFQYVVLLIFLCQNCKFTVLT